LLITVLAIRKSTANRGSEDSTEIYAHLIALIAVLIVDGPGRRRLSALIAVKVVDGKENVIPTSNFVKVLVDQFDGFTKDVFHCLLPSTSRARSPGDVLSPEPLAKQP
jgi:hypothetical protein